MGVAMDAGALAIRSMAQALEEVRALPRPYAPKDRLASEELIAERRDDAKRADAVAARTARQGPERWRSTGGRRSPAVLAVILEEPGADRVNAYRPGAKLSAVKLGEVEAKLRDLGMPEAILEAILDRLQGRPVPG